MFELLFHRRMLFATGICIYIISALETQLSGENHV